MNSRPAGPQAAPRLFHCTGQSNALSMALSTAHCTALLLAAPAGGAWNIILDSRAAFKERVYVQCTRASDSQMRVADRHGARVPGWQGGRAAKVALVAFVKGPLHADAIGRSSQLDYFSFDFKTNRSNHTNGCAPAWTKSKRAISKSRKS